MEFRIIGKLFGFFLVLFCCSCGVSDKIEIAFESPKATEKYFDNTPISVKLEVAGQPDSVVLVLNKEHRVSLQDNQANIPAENLLLGENVLVAQAYKKGKSSIKKYALFEVKTKTIPQKWQVKILRKIQHGKDAFTQGLFIHNGKLYETTGERGHSRLLCRDLENGKVLQTKKIDNRYFGEGATIWNNHIYYITWTSGQGFVFDADTFLQTATFQYGKYTEEGWGLTTIGEQFAMTNGTDKILFFNPQTMQLTKELSVNSNEGKWQSLNELEFDGIYLYANVWLTNKIVAINPKSGVVVAVIDCTNLVNLEENARYNPESDVLNGIAYNPETKTFYLTGKNWEHIYEVKILK
ncbi:MAG: glutaminyl-peptide cyclotransferase [Flavobacteriaceae bacterium]|nr:glutaminyl-peptide cyclotransferase [Flavobacteriaceae bacterium]